MYFATLASGSSGNCILVGNGNRSLLIDCGLSGKNLLHNLSLIDISPDQIEGIVVTHEHADHVKGVGIVARKLKIPILATPGLWYEMEQLGVLGKLAPQQRLEIQGDTFSLAGLIIKIFPTSHDSKESYGLRIESPENEKVLGIATDTGMITEPMHRNLRGCDALIVEANHDEERLWQGRYPWHLKKRISGNFGHLANKQLAEGLMEWIEERTQKVVLAHLSEENNTPELALSTVMRILRDSHIHKRCPQVRFRVAPRYMPHELISLAK